MPLTATISSLAGDVGVGDEMTLWLSRASDGA